TPTPEAPSRCPTPTGRLCRTGHRRAPTHTRVQTGTGPETIRELRRALVAGLLPDTYVSGGALVHMETVSGATVNPAADEDCPLPVSASPVTPASLAGLLAEHAYVYRLRTRKSDTGV